jgi:hypothetical protein
VSEGATTTSFTVSFEFFAAADLNVYVDGATKVLGSGSGQYAVSGGDGSTGAVALSVTGATGGSTVVITRDIGLERTTDFPSSGAFQIGTLNTELDRFVAISADLKDSSDRALQISDFDPAVSLVIPAVATRKGTVLGFNASTGAVEAGPNITAVQSLADVTTAINLLGTSDAVSDMNTLGTSTNVTNQNTLAGIAANITTVAGVASLITSDFVTDLNVLATSDIVTDLNVLATSDIVTDLNVLATTDIVADLAILATTDVVADLALLATTSVVSDLNAIAGGSGIGALTIDNITIDGDDIISDTHLTITTQSSGDINFKAAGGQTSFLGTSGEARIYIDNAATPSIVFTQTPGGGSAATTTLKIVDPTAARTILFPDASDTLVGKATTDTLTNKTLTTPVLNSPSITGDTSSGDNAAIGYTAAEGLILTGQGSTGDVTIKNDADAVVLQVPTGTTNVNIVGNLDVLTALTVDNINIDSNIISTTGSNLDLTLTPHGSGTVVTGTITLGGALKSNTVQSLDASSDLLLKHNTSTKLKVQSTGVYVDGTLTAITNTGAVLDMRTGDNNITDGDVLGKIIFSAPFDSSGTDALLTGAAIEAVAEGTFAADNNATELVFKTGASEVAATKMTLSSGGNLTVTGDVNVGDDLDVTGNTVIDGTLGVAGVSTFTDDVNIAKTGAGDDTTLKVASSSNSGDNDATVIVGNGGTGDSMIRFDYEGTNTDRARIGVIASDQVLRFYTGGDNERFKLTSAGAFVTGALDVSTNAVIDNTALVTGVLTTTAATVFNGGFASNAGSTITVADNNAALELICTDTDAASGPRIDLYRNPGQAGVDGDNLAQLNFYGLNDASEKSQYLYLFTEMADVADGSEDVRFLFGGLVAGADSSLIEFTHGTPATGADPELVFNNTSRDINFRVESENHTDALFVDAGDDKTYFGKSSSALSAAGIEAHPTGRFMATYDGGLIGQFNRLSSDGSILEFYKDGTAVGSIGANGGDLTIHSTATSHVGLIFGNTRIQPTDNAGAVSNGASDLGYSNSRFKDLYLSGTILSGSPASGTPVITTSNAGASGTRYHLLFKEGATDRGSITTNGSATAFNTSSDYRLKTDAQPMTGASARVQALNPVNFEWIASGDRVDGFLAHEAQAIVPEAVTGTKDAMRDEEYQVSAATGDIYTPAAEAYVDEDDNAVDAVDEVIHSANAEQPETLEDGQQWRETTAAVMGTRSVPDMQGIDQGKMVPLLVASLQEALTEIAALKVRITALEGA